MKNKIFRIAIALCSCIVAISCNDSEPEFITDDPPFTEPTLAGTITFHTAYYIKDAEGTFDGKTLEDLQKHLESTLDISEKSDTEVYMYCRSVWGKESIIITIPLIPISGEPYNVSFNHVTDKGVIIFDDIRTGVRTSVKGWIKEDTNGETRNSPAILDYLCDITIETSFDNKPLRIRIKRIDPTQWKD